jgi:putative tricarboxylic transport membrane protein
MLELLGAGLVNAFSLNNMLMITLGVAIGNIVGAMPGLTPTMAVAVALPVTFVMSPVASIAFLMGIAKGGTCGCGLTSIAIGIPGIPAATCTIMDGYPLMKAGKGRQAMQMAIYSSCIADFMSDIVMILACVPLASIAMRFGPPELTTLFAFSLVTIGGVTGDQPLKGLIAAAVGLFLGTIGMDPMSGSPRFAFGSINLMGGLSVIPVLIGLYAIPEILDQVTKMAHQARVQHEETENQPKKPDTSRVTARDMRMCLPAILRGGIIGTLVGAIPGIGSSVGAFITYSETKRVSKHPELFGKGALEGVAASEAGNSAVNGANLIPLLTLGIPGETVAAVLLGAFTIHGLHPGPLLIQQHGSLIYTMFAAMLIANIVNLIFAKEVMIRSLFYVLRMPMTLLMPIIGVLCVIGSYAVNNSMFDVLMMALFGIVGFAMHMYEYPRTPLVIALLLGPMLEPALRQTLLMGGISLIVRRPIALLFLCLTIVLVVFTIKKQRTVSGGSETSIAEQC